MNKDLFNKFLSNSLLEDIGDGDHTSLACIPNSALGTAELIVKQKGIIAGVQIAEMLFREIDKELIFIKRINDGSEVIPGMIAFTVNGKIQTILKSERLVLNIMQRMSGIATVTNEYCEKVKGSDTKILDTRKTTPGFRYFEKEAVRIGGGGNHRMGLFDMIMIKDNHIDFAGGIEKAILLVYNYQKVNNKNLKVEIESRSLEDVKEILKIGMIDRIMFDNFSVENTRKAVNLVAGKYETESSGNITLDTIRSYAETGVDYVSVGSLTHQVKSLDLSLKAKF
ncbi:MAG: carboxylating nicotinate-nucleotide diphosphorylase [Bacteroidota bacterium]